MTLGAMEPLINLNFVQDVPTPHNNDLLSALNERDGIRLRAWYRRRSSSDYGFASDLSSQVVTPEYYGSLGSGSRMLFQAMTKRTEHWFLVHWSNPATKAFLVLAWATRRRFNIWFDLPEEQTSGRRTRRDIAQWVLRRSRARIFCVGRMTVEYFLERGFPEASLVNLPVVMSQSAHTDEESESERTVTLRERHNIPHDCFLIATGSRLVWEKGFDVLVTAMAKLDPDTGSRVLAIIVGQGEEADALRDQVESLSLHDRVRLWPWLEAEEFRALFAAADLIVHPSRMDAYGGPALIALAEGRPLVGTRQAGGSVDIVDEGVNGLLYDAEDAVALAKTIEALASSPEELDRLAAGMAALRTSAQRTPEGASDVLIQRMI